MAGRANAQSKVQLEGSTDWKPLSDFPEFADALNPKPTPSSTSSFGADAEGLASRILAHINRPQRHLKILSNRCNAALWALASFHLYFAR